MLCTNARINPNILPGYRIVHASVTSIILPGAWEHRVHNYYKLIIMSFRPAPSRNRGERFVVRDRFLLLHSEDRLSLEFTGRELSVARAKTSNPVTRTFALSNSVEVSVVNQYSFKNNVQYPARENNQHFILFHFI